MVDHLTIRETSRHLSSLGDNPPPHEHVLFLQCDRKREEFLGGAGYRLHARGRTIFRTAPRTAMITRCDLKQVFHLNLDDREYAAWPLQVYPDVHDPRDASGRQERVLTREPTVLVETETVDTGERKELFGYSARHVITTTRVTPLAGPQRRSTPTMTDGWYIDLDTQCSCDPPWRPGVGQAFLTLSKAGDEGDVPTFTNVGELERGYALSRRVTSQHNLTFADGSVTQVTSVLETAVTYLSMAKIDPATFEILAGFQLVDAIRQEPKPPLIIRWKQTYDRVARRFSSAPGTVEG